MFFALLKYLTDMIKPKNQPYTFGSFASPKKNEYFLMKNYPKIIIYIYTFQILTIITINP